LGHFLYYSGLINWRTIIQALIWQRTERPRLGEIGQRFGLLNEADVVHILRNRPILQPFGQTAMDLGLLSQPQLQMLVAHQKRLQKKFGEFFLEKQILEPSELRTLLQQYQEHNARVSGQMHGSAFRR
ncbi:MAG: molecular chaperone DnaJ, partial [Desulfurivibrionaceae bacterium]